MKKEFKTSEFNKLTKIRNRINNIYSKMKNNLKIFDTQSLIFFTNKEKVFIYITKANNLLVKNNKGKIGENNLSYIYIYNNVLEYCIVANNNDINYEENVDEYLIEGYLFNNQKHFTNNSNNIYFGNLIFPYIDNFVEKLNILNNIFFQNDLKYNYLTQDKGNPFDFKFNGILPFIFSDDPLYDLKMKLIFNNFKYSKNLNTKKTIYSNNQYEISEFYTNNKKEIKLKYICFTKYGIYSVYNIDNNNFEGYLYIKSAKNFNIIKKKIPNDNSIQIKCGCMFNLNFMKWEIIYFENENLKLTGT